MKYLQYLVIYPVLSIILASGLLFSVFGVGSLSDTTKSNISKQKADENIDKTLRVKWQGESNLFNETGAPVVNDEFVSNEQGNDEDNDQIDYLIRLAKISAAVSNYSKFALESRKADSSVMEVFWKIEAVSSVGAETMDLYASVKESLKKKNIRLVEEELRILSEPESVSDLANHDYDNRHKKRQIEAKIDAIQYSLSEDAFETSSVNNVMKASNALLREAGRIMEKAISENGLIHDEVAYLKAASLIEATQAVKPASNYPYCDIELSIANNVKNKIEALLSNLKKFKFSDKGESLVNAGDIYATAEAALQMRAGNSYVNSCSERLYVSQN